MPFDSKNPILLSTNSYLTRLIVEEAHEIVKHNGVRETLTELRRLWIPRGRNFIRRLIHQCHKCRLYMGKLYNYPEAPPLPESRVQYDYAFKAIGIDYAGPVHLKNVFGEEQNTYKSWISLITCTSTRAIYLDLASNLTGHECIELLKRFISKRGAPNNIISDNGKSFIRCPKLRSI